MYIQVFEGWRYLPNARAKRVEQLEKLRVEHGGRSPLTPELPGLMAQLWGTDPNDPDAGVAVLVWESKEAAAPYQWLDNPELRRPLEGYMDLSNAAIRNLDGIYFAHRYRLGGT
ncbi:MAG: hypothetical protein HY731_07260 [Candidatus Tectomicrobia bacterium]|nr:hypothetical protein [Candidatus Tectomicrobia bacterium]